MKRKWAFVICLCLFAMFMGQDYSHSNPPFTDNEIIKSFENEGLKHERLTALYELRINSLPYLLTKYLNEGNAVTLQTVKETFDSIELIVDVMGKTVSNNRDKETFAKLLGGAGKLQKSVERNIKAIQDYKRIRQVFWQRSNDLLRLVGASETDSGYDERILDLSNEGTDHRDLQKLRILLLKAVRQTGAGHIRSLGPPVGRSSISGMWDSAIELTARVADNVSSPGDKILYVRLKSLVGNVAGLSQSLNIAMDELNQSWDEVQTVLDNMEAVVRHPEEEPPQQEKDNQETKEQKK